MNDIALDVDEEDIVASALGTSKVKPGYVRSKARRPMAARFALVCSTGGMSCLSAGKHYKWRSFCRLSLNLMNPAYLNSAFLLK
jgi:hypothetical protein